MARNFEFSVTPHVIAGCTVLVVEGELDIFTAETLEQALAATDGMPVIVDLSAATFIDSAAIHTLLKERPAGRPAVARTPRSNIAKVLDIVDVKHSVEIYDDVAAAVARLGAVSCP